MYLVITHMIDELKLLLFNLFTYFSVGCIKRSALRPYYEDISVFIFVPSGRCATFFHKIQHDNSHTVTINKKVNKTAPSVMMTPMNCQNTVKLSK